MGRRQAFLPVAFLWAILSGADEHVRNVLRVGNIPVSE